MLPEDIVAIIHDYRMAFERVDNEIMDMLGLYYTTENRATEVLELVSSMVLTDFHFKNIKIMLSDITKECSKIVSGVLEEETINPVQQLMMNNLANQIDYNNIFPVLFHPLCFMNFL